MIKITKNYTILNGEAPFTIFSSGDSTITMLTSTTFEVEYTFENVDSIEDRSISVIDNKGCISALSVGSSTLNPCNSFFVSPIVKMGQRYSVDVTSDSSFTYDWDFDEALFEGTPQSNFIDLRQVAGGPVNSTLSVTVTNSDGCTATEQFTLPVCRAFARNEVAQFVQVGNNYVANVALRSNSTCTEGINWNTLQITGDTVGLTIVTNGPNVTFTSPTPPADVVLNYTVRDNTDILSNTATISLSSNGQLGLSVPDILINSLPTVGDFDFDITNDIRDFVDPLSINVNNNLTTSNVTATNNGAVFSVTMAGTTGVVGYDAQDINGNVLNPGVISLRRDFADFTTTNVVVTSPCSGATFTYVLASNPSVTEITSVVGANGITKNGINPVALDITNEAPTQTITLNVKNGNNQTGTITLDYCRSCETTTVNAEVCEATINPYSLLVKPTPNGTWTTSNGAPLPLTYNGDVTLPTTGLYSYVYSVDNTTPGGETCPVIDSPLEVTRVNFTAIANNDCANASAMFSITDAGTSANVGTISEACASTTTFSKVGSNGNLPDFNYDQWFTYESSSTFNGATSMDITVTVTGTGGTPLPSPSVQVWSSCVTAVVTSYNQTANQVVATFNVPTDGSLNDYLIQVLSNGVGDYSLLIEQTIV